MIPIENVISDISLILSLFLLVVCGIFHLFPPKKINYLYGYRTSRSMKSQKHWDFAQPYSNRRMAEYAIFLLFAGLILLALNMPPENNAVSGIIALLGMPAYLMYRTEIALKKKFPNN